MKHKSRFILFFLFWAVVSYSQTPQYYNYNVTGSTNSFPFNIPGGKEVQVLFLPGDFNQPTPAPAGNITSVSFRLAAALGPYTYSNFYIRMGQASGLTTFATGVWYTGPMDTVYSRASVSLGGLANEWMTINLDRPFNYDPAQSLIVEVNQCGATGATGFSTGTTTLAGNRRNTSLVNTSCPFAWGQQSGTMPHMGVNISTASAPKNFTMTLPTPGVNTNYITIPFAAGMTGFTNVTIEAWVKPGGLSTANTILNKGAASFDYQLGINTTTGNPFFRAGATIVTSTGTVTAGTWQHIAVTANGTTVNFYKNGALLSTHATATTLGSSSNEMRIGRGNNDPGSGNIDEVRLWSVARTQGQIDSNKCKKFPSTFSSSAGLKAIWHLDSTLVDSVSGFNGTAMGNVTYDTVSFPILGVCTVTGITPVVSSTPQDYSLSQNYPNPFNPSTTIEFSLPKDEYVEIKLYDIVGKEAAVLVSGKFGSGGHSVNLNLSYLSSGTYFYKMTAGRFINTKKLILMK
ncbi:MAG: T9SS type A sorting domain-containing protein [Bacteroidetes bacterium]|nr:T9SS type A sorting domain-containing protein [Bacteroidota bacterium]